METGPAGSLLEPEHIGAPPTVSRLGCPQHAGRTGRSQAPTGPAALTYEPSVPS